MTGLRIMSRIGLSINCYRILSKDCSNEGGDDHGLPLLHETLTSLKQMSLCMVSWCETGLRTSKSNCSREKQTWASVWGPDCVALSTLPLPKESHVSKPRVSVGGFIYREAQRNGLVNQPYREGGEIRSREIGLKYLKKNCHHGNED